MVSSTMIPIDNDTQADRHDASATRSYAYSFDREAYIGRYASRDEARAAAVSALRNRRVPPDGLYVARRVTPDLHVEGLSETVVDALRDAFGRDRDPDRLDRIDDDDLSDLDAALAHTVRAWLLRRDLVRDPEEFEAISEHPLPIVKHVRQPETLEVGPLGES